MKLSEIASTLDLEIVNGKKLNDEISIEYGYSCDLLSQVLAKAKKNSIWITIQSHLNIVGVATMTGIQAIIVCEGHGIARDVIERADEESIALFRSPQNAFELSGKLYECGIR